MSAFQNAAGNQTPRDQARRSVGFALGVVVLFFLSSLPQETRAQPVALTPDEINGLRARLRQCWKPPAGVAQAMKGRLSLRLRLKPDGSLAGKPVVIDDTSSAAGPALANSAVRAIETCQPFTMLKPEHYDGWKDITVDFDPTELLDR